MPPLPAAATGCQQPKEIPVKHLSYLITATFGFTEDQDAAAVHFLFKQGPQLGILLVVADDLDCLCDGVVGFEVGVPYRDLQPQAATSSEV